MALVENVRFTILKTPRTPQQKLKQRGDPYQLFLSTEMKGGVGEPQNRAARPENQPK